MLSLSYGLLEIWKPARESDGRIGVKEAGMNAYFAWTPVLSTISWPRIAEALLRD
jgi:hypothetical protein